MDVSFSTWDKLQSMFSSAFGPPMLLYSSIRHQHVVLKHSQRSLSRCLRLRVHAVGRKSLNHWAHTAR
jgi:hypothetical protein